MRDISTEIIIDASRSDVWRVLVDMPGYNRWNPFMTYEGGEVKVGATLHLNVHLPGAWVTPTQVRVLTVNPEQELVWLGHFLNIPRLIDGYHSFLLIENGPDQTRLVHKEHFEGVLLPFFFGWFTERKIKQGMERMNPALKRVVETVRR
ncbi:MAG: SRPBCC domain-containing protein [Elusimicrobia bacterium]|nr:SRPBCC domain-containing protein [Elusimicrobiota bacterium]